MTLQKTKHLTIKQKKRPTTYHAKSDDPKDIIKEAVQHTRRIYKDGPKLPHRGNAGSNYNDILYIPEGRSAQEIITALDSTLGIKESQGPAYNSNSYTCRTSNYYGRECVTVYQNQVKDSFSYFIKNEINEWNGVSTHQPRHLSELDIAKSKLAEIVYLNSQDTGGHLPKGGTNGGKYNVIYPVDDITVNDIKTWFDAIQKQDKNFPKYKAIIGFEKGTKMCKNL